MRASVVMSLVLLLALTPSCGDSAPPAADSQSGAEPQKRAGAEEAAPAPAPDPELELTLTSLTLTDEAIRFDISIENSAPYAVRVSHDYLTWVLILHLSLERSDGDPIDLTVPKAHRSPPRPQVAFGAHATDVVGQGRTSLSLSFPDYASLIDGRTGKPLSSLMKEGEAITDVQWSVHDTGWVRVNGALRDATFRGAGALAIHRER